MDENAVQNNFKSLFGHTLWLIQNPTNVNQRKYVLDNLEALAKTIFKGEELKDLTKQIAKLR
jgi:hypothetical protein